MRALDRASALWLAALVAVASLGPWLVADPTLVDLRAPLEAPSAAHWLGTDGIGRDVLARWVHGARASLLVGLGAMLLSSVLALSSAVTLRRGRLDAALDALLDVLQLFPFLILLIGLRALWPSAGLGALVAILGLSRSVSLARVARAELARLRGAGWVEASRALGASEAHLWWRHVAPALLVAIRPSLVLGLAGNIAAEGALSFLGLGVPPPAATWGELLQQARANPGHPGLWLPVSLALALTIGALGHLAGRPTFSSSEKLRNSPT